MRSPDWPADRVGMLLFAAILMFPKELISEERFLGSDRPHVPPSRRINGTDERRDIHDTG
jgi:hypothetical protein